MKAFPLIKLTWRHTEHVWWRSHKNNYVFSVIRQRAKQKLSVTYQSPFDINESALRVCGAYWHKNVLCESQTLIIALVQRECKSVVMKGEESFVYNLFCSSQLIQTISAVDTDEPLVGHKFVFTISPTNPNFTVVDREGKLCIFTEKITKLKFFNM